MKLTESKIDTPVAMSKLPATILDRIAHWLALCGLAPVGAPFIRFSSDQTDKPYQVES